MIVKLENKLLQQSLENKKILSFLKLLHSLTELNKHQFYFEGVDLDLFKSIFSDNIELEYNYLQNAYENISYIVIVCSTEIIEQKITDFSERGITYKTYNQGKRLFVERGDFINDFITWELIDSYLNQPLKIVVENSESDKLFLSTCLNLIGNIPVSDFENDSIIEFVHGGGNTIETPLQNIKGRNRLFCMFDSDKTSENEYINKEVENRKLSIKKLCNHFGYSFHELQKRTIENYLPDNAIVEYCKTTTTNSLKDSYLLSNDTDKDYFEMKKIHKHLFKAFNHVTTKEELKSRDKNGELEVIVKKIKQLI